MTNLDNDWVAFRARVSKTHPSILHCVLDQRDDGVFIKIPSKSALTAWIAVGSKLPASLAGIAVETTFNYADAPQKQINKYSDYFHQKEIDALKNKIGLLQNQLDFARKQILIMKMDSAPQENSNGDFEYPRLKISFIKDEVVKYFNLDPEILYSQRRRRDITRPRQIAVWLVRVIRPDLTYPQIGIGFDRDHSTIFHAIQAVRKLIENNDEMGIHAKILLKMLKEQKNEQNENQSAGNSCAAE